MARSQNRHAYRNYWSKIEKAKKRAEARRKWEAERAAALRTGRRPRKKRVALSQTKQQSQAKLKRARLPLQRNGRNLEKLNSVLPQAIRDAIDARHLPGAIVWGSCDRPIVAGPLSRRGGRFVIVDGFSLGAEKQAEKPLPGFLGTIGKRIFRSNAWEFANSLRSPFAADLPATNWLLACPARRSRKGQKLILPAYRASSDSSKAIKRAQRYAPDAMHFFQTGQGKGICGFRGLLLGATIARCQGFNVDIEVVGASDRLLRSGNWLAQTVLAGAGIKLTAIESPIEDAPYADGQTRLAQNNLRGRRQLKSLLSHYLCRLHSEETIPELRAERLGDLPGLKQTLAVGAGLDWATREDMVSLGLDRHILAKLATHRSWRGNAGSGGSWLVEPGFRQKMGLSTQLRPILLEYYEASILELIKWRFPSAELLEPIVIRPCHFQADISEKNVRELSWCVGEQLIAVDHATIHWGSVLDLDLMLRQRSCGLRTIFCSSYAAPTTALEVLQEAVLMFSA